MKTQMQLAEKEIIEKLSQQEKFLLSLRETLEQRDVNRDQNKLWIFEKAKFMGMLELASEIGIDTQEFNWIYL